MLGEKILTKMRNISFSKFISPEKSFSGRKLMALNLQLYAYDLEPLQIFATSNTIYRT
jgi:hypothetical protein